MKFNPDYFLDICELSGLNLERKGAVISYRFRRKNAASINPDLLLATLRQHKADVLPLLEDTAKQTDLFLVFE